MGRPSPLSAGVFTALLMLLAASTTRINAAPVQETAMSRYTNEKGCYYMSELYPSGEKIETNEPCLNCTCVDSTLMCYLRVCPFVKPVGENCMSEKHVGDCCPKFWCPQVYPRVTTEKPDTEPRGCFLDSRYYDEGARIPMDPVKPCEVCYCIRNTSVCTMQECELKVDGCFPQYKAGSCCPARYNCTDEAATTIPPGVMEPEDYEGCRVGDKLHKDGDPVPSENKCETCFCMKHAVACSVQKCTAPADGCVQGKVESGQCCPTKYECPLTTEVPEWHSTLAPFGDDSTSNVSLTEGIEHEYTATEASTFDGIIHARTQSTEQESETSSVSTSTLQPFEPSAKDSASEEAILGRVTDAPEVVETSSFAEATWTSGASEVTEISEATVTSGATEASKESEISEVTGTTSSVTTESTTLSEVTETLSMQNVTVTTSDLVSRSREPKITEVPDEIFKTSTTRPVFFPSRPIPGEGTCRHENRTFKPKEKVSSLDPCRHNCMCVNSVWQCEIFVECVVAPRKNCKRMPPAVGECCPTYACEEETTSAPTSTTTLKEDLKTLADEVKPTTSETGKVTATGATTLGIQEVSLDAEDVTESTTKHSQEPFTTQATTSSGIEQKIQETSETDVSEKTFVEKLEAVTTTQTAQKQESTIEEDIVVTQSSATQPPSSEGSEKLEDETASSVFQTVSETSRATTESTSTEGKAADDEAGEVTTTKSSTIFATEKLTSVTFETKEPSETEVPSKSTDQVKETQFTATPVVTSTSEVKLSTESSFTPDSRTTIDTTSELVSTKDGESTLLQESDLIETKPTVKTTIQEDEHETFDTSTSEAAFTHSTMGTTTVEILSTPKPSAESTLATEIVSEITDIESVEKTDEPEIKSENITVPSTDETQTTDVDDSSKSTKIEFKVTTSKSAITTDSSSLEDEKEAKTTLSTIPDKTDIITIEGIKTSTYGYSTTAVSDIPHSDETTYFQDTEDTSFTKTIKTSTESNVTDEEVEDKTFTTVSEEVSETTSTELKLIVTEAADTTTQSKPTETTRIEDEGSSTLQEESLDVTEFKYTVTDSVSSSVPITTKKSETETSFTTLKTTTDTPKIQFAETTLASHTEIITTQKEEEESKPTAATEKEITTFGITESDLKFETTQPSIDITASKITTFVSEAPVTTMKTSSPEELKATTSTVVEDKIDESTFIPKVGLSETVTPDSNLSTTVEVFDTESQSETSIMDKSIETSTLYLSTQTSEIASTTLKPETTHILDISVTTETPEEKVKTDETDAQSPAITAGIPFVEKLNETLDLTTELVTTTTTSSSETVTDTTKSSAVEGSLTTLKTAEQEIEASPSSPIMDSETTADFSTLHTFLSSKETTTATSVSEEPTIPHTTSETMISKETTIKLIEQSTTQEILLTTLPTTSEQAETSEIKVTEKEDKLTTKFEAVSDAKTDSQISTSTVSLDEITTDTVKTAIPEIKVITLEEDFTVVTVTDTSPKREFEVASLNKTEVGETDSTLETKLTEATQTSDVEFSSTVSSQTEKSTVSPSTSITTVTDGLDESKTNEILEGLPTTVDDTMSIHTDFSTVVKDAEEIDVSTESVTASGLTEASVETDVSKEHVTLSTATTEIPVTEMESTSIFVDKDRISTTLKTEKDQIDEKTTDLSSIHETTSMEIKTSTDSITTLLDGSVKSTLQSVDKSTTVSETESTTFKLKEVTEIMSTITDTPHTGKAEISTEAVISTSTELSITSEKESTSIHSEKATTPSLEDSEKLEDDKEVSGVDSILPRVPLSTSSPETEKDIVTTQATVTEIMESEISKTSESITDKPTVEWSTFSNTTVAESVTVTSSTTSAISDKETEEISTFYEKFSTPTEDLHTSTLSGELFDTELNETTIEFTSSEESKDPETLRAQTTSPSESHQVITESVKVTLQDLNTTEISTQEVFTTPSSKPETSETTEEFKSSTYTIDFTTKKVAALDETLPTLMDDIPKSTIETIKEKTRTTTHTIMPETTITVTEHADEKAHTPSFESTEVDEKIFVTDFKADNATAGTEMLLETSSVIPTTESGAEILSTTERTLTTIIEMKAESDSPFSTTPDEMTDFPEKLSTHVLESDATTLISKITSTEKASPVDTTTVSESSEKLVTDETVTETSLLQATTLKSDVTYVSELEAESTTARVSTITDEIVSLAKKTTLVEEVTTESDKTKVTESTEAPLIQSTEKTTHLAAKTTSLAIELDEKYSTITAASTEIPDVVTPKETEIPDITTKLDTLVTEITSEHSTFGVTLESKTSTEVGSTLEDGTLSPGEIKITEIAQDRETTISSTTESDQEPIEHIVSSTPKISTESEYSEKTIETIEPEKVTVTSLSDVLKVNQTEITTPVVIIMDSTISSTDTESILIDKTSPETTSLFSTFEAETTTFAATSTLVDMGKSSIIPEIISTVTSTASTAKLFEPKLELTTLKDTDTTEDDKISFVHTTEATMSSPETLTTSKESFEDETEITSGHTASTASIPIETTSAKLADIISTKPDETTFIHPIETTSTKPAESTSALQDITSDFAKTSFESTTESSLSSITDFKQSHDETSEDLSTEVFEGDEKLTTSKSTYETKSPFYILSITHKTESTELTTPQSIFTGKDTFSDKEHVVTEKPKTTEISVQSTESQTEKSTESFLSTSEHIVTEYTLSTTTKFEAPFTTDSSKETQTEITKDIFTPESTTAVEAKTTEADEPISISTHTTKEDVEVKLLISTTVTPKIPDGTTVISEKVTSESKELFAPTVLDAEVSTLTSEKETEFKTHAPTKATTDLKLETTTHAAPAITDDIVRHTTIEETTDFPITESITESSVVSEEVIVSNVTFGIDSMVISHSTTIAPITSTQIEEELTTDRGTTIESTAPEISSTSQLDKIDIDRKGLKGEPAPVEKVTTEEILKTSTADTTPIPLKDITQFKPLTTIKVTESEEEAHEGTKETMRATTISEKSTPEIITQAQTTENTATKTASILLTTKETFLTTEETRDAEHTGITDYPSTQFDITEEKVDELSTTAEVVSTGLPKTTKDEFSAITTPKEIEITSKETTESLTESEKISTGQTDITTIQISTPDLSTAGTPSSIKFEDITTPKETTTTKTTEVPFQTVTTSATDEVPTSPKILSTDISTQKVELLGETVKSSTETVESETLIPTQQTLTGVPEESTLKEMSTVTKLTEVPVSETVSISTVTQEVETEESKQSTTDAYQTEEPKPSGTPETKTEEHRLPTTQETEMEEPKQSRTTAADVEEPTPQSTTEVAQTEESKQSTTQEAETEGPEQSTTAAAEVKYPTPQSTTEVAQTEESKQSTTQEAETEGPEQSTTAAAEVKDPTPQSTTDVAQTEESKQSTTQEAETQDFRIPTATTAEVKELTSQSTTQAAQTEDSKKPITQEAETEEPKQSTTAAEVKEPTPQSTTEAAHTEESKQSTTQETKVEDSRISTTQEYEAEELKLSTTTEAVEKTTHQSTTQETQTEESKLSTEVEDKTEAISIPKDQDETLVKETTLQVITPTTYADSHETSTASDVSEFIVTTEKVLFTDIPSILGKKLTEATQSPEIPSTTVLVSEEKDQSTMEAETSTHTVKTSTMSQTSEIPTTTVHKSSTDTMSPSETPVAEFTPTTEAPINTPVTSVLIKKTEPTESPQEDESLSTIGFEGIKETTDSPIEKHEETSEPVEIKASVTTTTIAAITVEPVSAVTESTSSTATTTTESATGTSSDILEAELTTPKEIEVKTTTQKAEEATTTEADNEKKNECFVNGTLYGSGQPIKTVEPCEKCHCASGEIVCFKIFCKLPMRGCVAEKFFADECCPSTYRCPADDGSLATVTFADAHSTTEKAFTTPIPISFMFSTTPSAIQSTTLVTKSDDQTLMTTVKEDLISDFTKESLSTSEKIEVISKTQESTKLPETSGTLSDDTITTIESRTEITTVVSDTRPTSTESHTETESKFTITLATDSVEESSIDAKDSSTTETHLTTSSAETTAIKDEYTTVKPTVTSETTEILTSSIALGRDKVTTTIPIDAKEVSSTPSEDIIDIESQSIKIETEAHSTTSSAETTTVKDEHITEKPIVTSGTTGIPTSSITLGTDKVTATTSTDAKEISATTLEDITDIDFQSVSAGTEVHLTTFSAEATTIKDELITEKPKSTSEITEISTSTVTRVTDKVTTTIASTDVVTTDSTTDIISSTNIPETTKEDIQTLDISTSESERTTTIFPPITVSEDLKTTFEATSSTKASETKEQSIMTSGYFDINTSTVTTQSAETTVSEKAIDEKTDEDSSKSAETTAETYTPAKLPKLITSTVKPTTEESRTKTQEPIFTTTKPSEFTTEKEIKQSTVEEKTTPIFVEKETETSVTFTETGLDEAVVTSIHIKTTPEITIVSDTTSTSVQPSLESSTLSETFTTEIKTQVSDEESSFSSSVSTLETVIDDFKTTKAPLDSTPDSISKEVHTTESESEELSEKVTETPSTAATSEVLTSARPEITQETVTETTKTVQTISSLQKSTLPKDLEVETDFVPKTTISEYKPKEVDLLTSPDIEQSSSPSTTLEVTTEIREIEKTEKSSVTTEGTKTEFSDVSPTSTTMTFISTEEDVHVSTQEAESTESFESITETIEYKGTIPSLSKEGTTLSETTETDIPAITVKSEDRLTSTTEGPQSLQPKTTVALDEAKSTDTVFRFVSTRFTDKAKETTSSEDFRETTVSIPEQVSAIITKEVMTTKGPSIKSLDTEAPFMKESTVTQEPTAEVPSSQSVTTPESTETTEKQYTEEIIDRVQNETVVTQFDHSEGVTQEDSSEVFSTQSPTEIVKVDEEHIVTTIPTTVTQHSTLLMSTTEIGSFTTPEVKITTKTDEEHLPFTAERITSITSSKPTTESETTDSEKLPVTAGTELPSTSSPPGSSSEITTTQPEETTTKVKTTLTTDRSTEKEMSPKSISMTDDLFAQSIETTSKAFDAETTTHIYKEISLTTLEEQLDEEVSSQPESTLSVVADTTKPSTVSVSSSESTLFITSTAVISESLPPVGLSTTIESSETPVPTMAPTTLTDLSTEERQTTESIVSKEETSKSLHTTTTEIKTTTDKFTTPSLVGEIISTTSSIQVTAESDAETTSSSVIPMDKDSRIALGPSKVEFTTEDIVSKVTESVTSTEPSTVKITELPTEKDTKASTEQTPDSSTEKSITSERTTVATTRASSEVSTESGTEVATEKSTITERVTVVTSELATEISTEKATEVSPEKFTEAVSTERSTEVPSERITEAPTEETPEASTVNATDVITEKAATLSTSVSSIITDASTEKTTEAVSEKTVTQSTFESTTKRDTEMPTKAYKAIETTPTALTTESSVTENATAAEAEDDFLLDEGVCIFEGQIYHSAEQILRSDPCEFCFCFRGDIICLQQSCPPPAPNCHSTMIPGYCCPRYDCPVLVTSRNMTNLTRRKGVQPIIIQKRIEKRAVRAAVEVKGCQIDGKFYPVGSPVAKASGPCLHCECEEGGNMRCDPIKCKPEAPLMLKMNNHFFRNR